MTTVERLEFIHRRATAVNDKFECFTKTEKANSKINCTACY
jgi:hypothetical protein